MNLLDRARALMQEGRRDEAIALVEREAEAGDAEACYAVANWRLYGTYAPRDPPTALHYLGLAAGRGHAEATRALAYLVAGGTGCDADPAEGRRLLAPLAEDDPDIAAQLALLDRMPPPDAAHDLPRAQLSDDPWIVRIRGLFTPEECAHLIRAGEPQLRPSFVIDPTSGRPAPHPVRTSSSMNFAPTAEDLAINALNRRIAAATGTAVACGEPLQILRYAPGEEYRRHLDGLSGVANQRTLTALVYLNNSYEGGETEFPELGLRCRFETGDMLAFRNAGFDGRPDPRTLHAGLPVRAGVKWLASRWIRQQPHDPWSV